jgi:hypothetical protein
VYIGTRKAPAAPVWAHTQPSFRIFNLWELKCSTKKNTKKIPKLKQTIVKKKVIAKKKEIITKKNVKQIPNENIGNK